MTAICHIYAHILTGPALLLLRESNIDRARQLLDVMAQDREAMYVYFDTEGNSQASLPTRCHVGPGGDKFVLQTAIFRLNLARLGSSLLFYMSTNHPIYLWPIGVIQYNFDWWEQR